MMDVQTRRSLESMFPGGQIDESTERLANQVSEKLEATGSRTIRKDVLAFIAVMAERNGSNGSVVSTSTGPGEVKNVHRFEVVTSSEDDLEALDPSPAASAADDLDALGPLGPEVQWDTIQKGTRLAFTGTNRKNEGVSYESPWGAGRVKVLGDNGKVTVAHKVELCLTGEAPA